MLNIKNLLLIVGIKLDILGGYTLYVKIMFWFWFSEYIL